MALILPQAEQAEVLELLAVLRFAVGLQLVVSDLMLKAVVALDNRGSRNT